MPFIQVVAAIILKHDQVLIAQRPSGKHKGGYWEFPGGKIESGESEIAALRRELLEEINIEISAAEGFADICFDYPEKSVQLKFFTITDYDGDPIGLEGQQIRWVSRLKLSEYQFPEANLPIVEKLATWNSDC